MDHVKLNVDDKYMRGKHQNYDKSGNRKSTLQTI